MVALYLIEILHQTTTNFRSPSPSKGCILSKFYIKPQRSQQRLSTTKSCILSKFYIKPQQLFECFIAERVVSYRNSTSNHNSLSNASSLNVVVSYRNSTSNHNKLPITITIEGLYLIEILHQTTTVTNARMPPSRVVSYRNSTSNHNIWTDKTDQEIVVSYRNSTSNHNLHFVHSHLSFVVSYRNSTSNHNS